jgi:hypothetical protein
LKLEGPPASTAAGLKLALDYVRIGNRAKAACR